jgi:hypothetical protein
MKKLNRTGIDASPADSRESISAASAAVPSVGDATLISGLRKLYIGESEPVGTVPIPGTLKGVAKAAAKKLAGKRPEVLIDKLGARAAFERSGVRLYEAFLTKLEALGTAGVSDFSIERVKQFLDEEARHYAIARDALKELGADPTAVTPAADVDGVMSIGLVQVMTDPRTTIEQCLSALLVAELADNDGWSMLIGLTEEMGLGKMAGSFRSAKSEEDEHLASVRRWLGELLLEKEAKAA